MIRTKLPASPPWTFQPGKPSSSPDSGGPGGSCSCLNSGRPPSLGPSPAPPAPIAKRVIRTSRVGAATGWKRVRADRARWSGAPPGPRPKSGRRGGERGGEGAGPASGFATSLGSPHKMKARALAFSRTSEVLGRAPSRVSDLIRPVQPGPPRPPRAELASRKLQVRRLCSRGRPQSCRRLPAEMPGKKARKNAQPSPARAPAGRDLMGRRSWPGRGGRDGVEVSIGAGSARLLGASGLAWSAPLHVLSGRLVEVLRGVLSRTAETAREGPRFGIGMQRYFSGCRKPLRPPSIRTCPALATGKNSANAGASNQEKVIVTAGGDGRSSGHYLASQRFLRQASSSGVLDLGGPGARRDHTLHPQRKRKQR
ncbi:hypothetical protein QTO34_002128 [Cnephaeus nilssonii]|uniref:Uncharacterized protein n=1 Tax=Cnephaeus nilssonii TaxID=3371016 RepID=A0AA40LN44_CNENI|nr:hypothetical protein QTO34_002128 [Eptesicus nilssonii]